ncbi:MAG: DinB family protein [Planctomycetes bacterium]|nr:DinB family protein [Planctomycetota bacterium]
MSERDAADGSLAGAIAIEFRRRLQGEYVPRIRQCVELLGAAVWQRPAANCNSVANLLLHLTGNTQQWIQANFGRGQDRRDRPAEFAAATGPSGAALVDRLAAVVDEACDVIDALGLDDWTRPRTVQGQFTETGLSSILHVLEHFSGHAGQIYAWTKQVTGRDLEFYSL